MPISKTTIPQLMFIGDMHIGRNPIRLPPHTTNPADFGPVRAWETSVALAIQERVTAVVLAGDVVDCMDDRFEAQRSLEPGLKRLQSAGIAVYAVVGNHDVKALPRLADLGLGLKLIGRGGQWQSIPLQHLGQEFCHLLGWSFHQTQMKTSPLESLNAEDVRDGSPTLGVLHCDLDQSQSPYAPVRQSEFELGEASRVNAWFLGHVHAPDHRGLRQSRPLGYLGSLVGLDPGEPGPHGPWLVSVAGATVTAHQHVVGPIIFDSHRVDLSDCSATSDLDIEDAIQEEFRLATSKFSTESVMQEGHIRAWGVRLILHGDVDRPQRFREIANRLQARGEFTRELEGCVYFVETLKFELRPPVNITALASGNGPLAYLANLLMQLEKSVLTPEISRLMETMKETAHESAWQTLPLQDYPTMQNSELIRENLLSILTHLHDEMSNPAHEARS